MFCVLVQSKTTVTFHISTTHIITTVLLTVEQHVKAVESKSDHCLSGTFKVFLTAISKTTCGMFLVLQRYRFLYRITLTVKTHSAKTNVASPCA